MVADSPSGQSESSRIAAPRDLKADYYHDKKVHFTGTLPKGVTGM